ncbi:TlyA family RNA methyltransferase [Adlercreutzia sp. ZJ304]|uniref:TlyA family RNA methyltransferase n=1 Tax=Adlercreutzia sp. ZJ304 TaxID=2709791 RepID=UPI0013ECA8AB|nr:TlyA family RNA methyltransferase [Adlercreutzia sp. ZJ304]
MAQKKIRLDELLIKRGICADAEEALRRVLAREVRVEDVYASSAAMMVPPNVNLFVKHEKQFVSRGGHKLQGALNAFGQNVSNMRCIDIGSSTGGFTDCLLQAGAKSVTCVDVNYGQLAWSIRTDPRVEVFERTNIKLANPQELGAPFDLIVIDVSFIGLASLAPIFPKLAQRGSVFIGLVKPQFESRHEETDRGVVRNETIRVRTVAEVKEALEKEGFRVTNTQKSSITGPKGNVEYLVHAVFEG